MRYYLVNGNGFVISSSFFLMLLKDSAGNAIFPHLSLVFFSLYKCSTALFTLLLCIFSHGFNPQFNKSVYSNLLPQKVDYIRITGITFPFCFL